MRISTGHADWLRIARYSSNIQCFGITEEIVSSGCTYGVRNKDGMSNEPSRFEFSQEPLLRSPLGEYVLVAKTLHSKDRIPFREIISLAEVR